MGQLMGCSFVCGAGLAQSPCAYNVCLHRVLLLLLRCLVGDCRCPFGEWPAATGCRFAPNAERKRRKHRSCVSCV